MAGLTPNAAFRPSMPLSARRAQPLFHLHHLPHQMPPTCGKGLGLDPPHHRSRRHAVLAFTHSPIAQISGKATPLFLKFVALPALKLLQWNLCPSGTLMMHMALRILVTKSVAFMSHSNLPGVTLHLHMHCLKKHAPQNVVPSGLPWHLQARRNVLP